MEYRIESLQGFTLVGMSIECKMSDISGIAPLWDKFVPRMCEVAGMSGVWGACLSNNDPEGFTYIAGCEVPAGTAPPVGMARFEVPAHKYLVTKYVGAAAEMGKHW